MLTRGFAWPKFRKHPDEHLSPKVAVVTTTAFFHSMHSLISSRVFMAGLDSVQRDRAAAARVPAAGARPQESAAAIRVRSAASGIAPIHRSTTAPLLTIIIVGIDWIS